MITLNLDNDWLDVSGILSECKTAQGKTGAINVLIACEYSDTVAAAFRSRGHFAVTNDLLDSDSVAGQAIHLQGDILDAIDAFQWDLIIMHPPCTSLCVAGNRHYGTGKPKHQERLQAIAWTNTVWNYAVATGAAVCLENPVGVLKLQDGTKPAYVQPYQFGHMEQKKTGLWLHGLPPLVETDNVHDAMMKLPLKERQRIWYMSPSENRWKERSKTYAGIAAAMADQWGRYLNADNYLEFESA